MPRTVVALGTGLMPDVTTMLLAARVGLVVVVASGMLALVPASVVVVRGASAPIELPASLAILGDWPMSIVTVPITICGVDVTSIKRAGFN